MLFTIKQQNTGSRLDRIFTFKQLYYYKETTETKKLCSSCSFWSHVSVQKSPDHETL